MSTVMPAAFYKGLENKKISRIIESIQSKNHLYDPETGYSSKVPISDIAIRTGETGNGDTLFRSGSFWRKYFVVESFYQNGSRRLDIPRIGNWNIDSKGNFSLKNSGGKKIAIQLHGFYNIDRVKLGAISIKKMIASGKKKRCVWNGSTAGLEVDHKQGRANKLGWDQGENPSFYQILTQHNNLVKRNRCRICRVTNLRFDASKELGFKVPFLCGGSKFDDAGFGCSGCFLYDVEKFFKTVCSVDESSLGEILDGECLSKELIAAQKVIMENWPDGKNRQKFREWYLKELEFL